MVSTLDIDGRRVAYQTWGPPDGRPWVIHNGTPNARLLLFDPGVLDQAGVRAVSFDRPGYGASDRWPGRRVVDVVGDVAALADLLGWASFGVFGVSGGTPHALACGARLGARVNQIVVCGQIAPASMPGFTEAMLPFNREMFQLSQRDRGEYAKQLAAAAASVTADPLTAFMGMLAGIPDVDKEILSTAEMRDRTVAYLTEAFRSGSEGWYDDGMAFVSDWGFGLDEVRVPVRLYHGGLDVNCPQAHAEYVAANLPQATLTVWPEHGHVSAIARLTQTVAFDEP
jgi:pimeloyl-ACP methyl ester carboxylesterase